MKTIFLLALLLCFGSPLLAQSTYTLRIINTDGQPVKNVAVSAVNESIVLKGTTDNTGTVVFTLTEPGTYSFSYLEMKDVATYDVKEGIRGTYKRTTTYDPKGVFTTKPKVDRTGIAFKTVPALQMRSQANVTKVTILVKEKSGTRVPSLPLELVSCDQKTKYQGKTNASGEGIFYIPMNSEYEVDIEGIEAFHKFKTPNFANAEATEVVFYEKTKVSESTKGDTTIQRAITQTNGSSTHLLFTLNLNNYEGNPLADEPVYLKSQNSNRVYEGKTDAKGVCTFLLQKGGNYLVNLKYESEIHLVDATRTEGFSSASATRRYRGSNAIETMMAERSINAKGFVVNHEQTPVGVAQKPANYLTKTTEGFNIDFGNTGLIGTPTIADNKLFVQDGFHSPNFYALQAGTGQYLWGVELGESGISPAVFHQGVLLINTYSCTLYALDAATGKLLWSKWLAGTIYSTPSADGNSVYVVYNNGGRNPNGTEDFVLASFDLRTGKVNWMNWVDTEVIACPVVEGKEVHVASQSGNYYVFDKETGKPVLTSTTVKAVSSPTLTADKIYLTASVNGKEQLLVLNRGDLKVAKKYPTIISATMSNGDCYEHMNFNGSHPIVYKNKVILLLDSANLIAFDATTEKMLWKQPVSAHPNQLPLVANDKVVVATLSGEVLSYDINNGNVTTLRKNAGEVDGQPVSHNGFLFVASAGVLSVFKSLVQLPWSQWNKNAGHNLVVD
ncbi:MAG: PQQ-binding-like beta-propeller repeat protein [Bacteroidota bacterium]